MSSRSRIVFADVRSLVEDFFTRFPKLLEHAFVFRACQESITRAFESFLAGMTHVVLEALLASHEMYLTTTVAPSKTFVLVTMVKTALRQVASREVALAVFVSKRDPADPCKAPPSLDRLNDNVFRVRLEVDDDDEPVNNPSVWFHCPMNAAAMYERMTTTLMQRIIEVELPIAMR